MEVNSTPTIRFARMSDLAGITALLNHEILNSTAVYDYDVRSSEQMDLWWQTKQTNQFPVLIAEVDGQVAGFASYGQFRPWQGFHRSMEHSIYIHCDYHNRGLGKALLQSLLLEAKERKVHVLIAGIDSSNQKSIDFHLSFGFEKVGELKEVGFKFDRYLDLVFLQKILS